mmetsp:Transcript_8422/g.20942  ORF Transcript_8422/g.20942 Transcript_8422/m.20942 type:complete len:343 (+) Transcript_8422:913-1941(+)
MRFTAAFACSMPVLARAGAPRTSPAAYIPSMLVSSHLSTGMDPSLFLMTPSASSPSPSVLALRPAAVSSTSERISVSGSPVLDRTTLMDMGRLGPPAGPSDGRVTLSIWASKTMRTLFMFRSLCSPSVTSRSTPMRLSASSRERERTTIVTRQSSVEKIFAYSIAMMPAPTIVTLFGRNARVRIVSESKTRFPSYGIPGKSDDRDPVAMSVALPLTSTVRVDSKNVTLTVPASRMEAVPRRCGIRFAVTTSRLDCPQVLTMSDVKVSTCFQTVASRSPISRRVRTEIFFAASLRALLKSPVGPENCTRFFSVPSMMRHVRPPAAAASAAVNPVGPPPMTSRS